MPPPLRRRRKRPSTAAVVGNCAFSALIDRRGKSSGPACPVFDGRPRLQYLAGRPENGSVWAIDIKHFARSEHSTSRTRPCCARGCTTRMDAAWKSRTRAPLSSAATACSAADADPPCARSTTPCDPCAPASPLRMGQAGAAGTRAATTSAMWAGSDLRLNTDVSSICASETYFVLAARPTSCWAPMKQWPAGIDETRAIFEKETINYWRT